MCYLYTPSFKEANSLQLVFFWIFVFVKSLLSFLLGSTIGVGKESDVILALDEKGNEVLIKFHTLGQTFRTIKKNRDYLQNTKRGSGGGGKAMSWMYLSRLSAKVSIVIYFKF